MRQVYGSVSPTRDLKSETIGSGPFVLSKFERGVGFAAVKNPNYFEKGLPYLDGFEIPLITDCATRKASFGSGQADVVALDDPSELREVQSGDRLWGTVPATPRRQMIRRTGSLR